MRALLYAVIATLWAIAKAEPCDPSIGTCPDAVPGLNSDLYVDFTQQTTLPNDFILADYANISFSNYAGLNLSFVKRYDAPYIWSNKYFLFGRVDVAMQAAPGTGLITGCVLMSDNKDEIDFEWSGNNFGQNQGLVQSNYFGKGITGNYDRGTQESCKNPQTKVHIYSFDWSKDQITWEIDGIVVRTLKNTNQTGAYQFPQTPSRLHLGIWNAGDQDSPSGVVQWAGGYLPMNQTYSGYVNSVKIHPYMPCSSWQYPANFSGNWQDVKCTNQTVLNSTISSGSTYSNSSSAMIAPPGASSIPKPYVIKTGDTCDSIAKNMGCSRSDFQAANPHVNCQMLTTGVAVVSPTSNNSNGASSGTSQMGSGGSGSSPQATATVTTTVTITAASGSVCPNPTTVTTAASGSVCPAPSTVSVVGSGTVCPPMSTVTVTGNCGAQTGVQRTTTATGSSVVSPLTGPQPVINLTPSAMMGSIASVATSVSSSISSSSSTTSTTASNAPVISIASANSVTGSSTTLSSLSATSSVITSMTTLTTSSLCTLCSTFTTNGIVTSSCSQRMNTTVLTTAVTSTIPVTSTAQSSTSSSPPINLTPSSGSTAVGAQSSSSTSTSSLSSTSLPTTPFITTTIVPCSSCQGGTTTVTSTCSSYTSMVTITVPCSSCSNGSTVLTSSTTITLNSTTAPTYPNTTTSGVFTVNATMPSTTPLTSGPFTSTSSSVNTPTSCVYGTCMSTTIYSTTCQTSNGTPACATSMIPTQTCGGSICLTTPPVSTTSTTPPPPPPSTNSSSTSCTGNTCSSYMTTTNSCTTMGSGGSSCSIVTMPTSTCASTICITTSQSYPFTSTSTTSSVSSSILPPSTTPPPTTSSSTTICTGNTCSTYLKTTSSCTTLGSGGSTCSLVTTTTSSCASTICITTPQSYPSTSTVPSTSSTSSSYPFTSTISSRSSTSTSTYSSTSSSYPFSSTTTSSTSLMTLGSTTPGTLTITSTTSGTQTTYTVPATCTPSDTCFGCMLREENIDNAHSVAHGFCNDRSAAIPSWLTGCNGDRARMTSAFQCLTVSATPVPSGDSNGKACYRNPGGNGFLFGKVGGRGRGRRSAGGSDGAESDERSGFGVFRNFLKGGA